MPTPIHATAVVEPGAQLGANVEIGALAYVGAGVVLGDGTRLHHHAAVEGNTVLGADCEVFPFANIGAKTQDLKFDGGNPGVRIGARNVFREYVTIHGATAPDGHTLLGDDNVLLAYGHVAHDCILGNHIIASNSTGIAGHCVVEDHVVFGAVSGVHQFCRIGAHSMISAYAKIVQDIAPFMIADGQPAVIRAINKIGLERRGFVSEQLDRVKLIFRILFREGLNRSQALDKLKAHDAVDSDEFKAVLGFASASDRGLAPGA
ncbi:MAG: acyl-ACP--UDP-N-acetylglucosamine O-acyltransferase [Candidatus Synoicihabitans palmerolidicus]|nr:acyl-ACP--UDP-N-acetylglucosamine O-acyltransferase [Candidatus Synoicihabitans palmerolidicus]